MLLLRSRGLVILHLSTAQASRRVPFLDETDQVGSGYALFLWANGIRVLRALSVKRDIRLSVEFLQC